MRCNFTYARDGAATELLPNDTTVSCQLPSGSSQPVC